MNSWFSWFCCAAMVCCSWPFSMAANFSLTLAFTASMARCVVQQQSAIWRLSA